MFCGDSADDSDTPYIDPNTESSDQRPSSASSRPTRSRTLGGTTVSNGTNDLYDEVYSEITSQDTELLIKPSASRHGAKTRRNVYASKSFGMFLALLDTIVVKLLLKRTKLSEVVESYGLVEWSSNKSCMRSSPIAFICVQLNKFIDETFTGLFLCVNSYVVSFLVLFDV